MPKPTLHPEFWVDNYADYLLQYTHTKVNDRELAKDLVQDTFIAALQAAANFKGEASEKTWLVSILKRKIIDHYRKKNSKKGQAEINMGFLHHEDESGDWLEERAKDTSYKSGDDHLENLELGLAIQNCMEALPEKQAKAFRMKTIDLIDTEEICNELNINPSNLWVILHRARTSLINCLNENWF